MRYRLAPLFCRPWTLNGISERMIVSHYENNYGGAVRTLNAVRRELAELDGGTSPYRLRTLKREEHSAMGSVALHELYFGNLGNETINGFNAKDQIAISHTLLASFMAAVGAASQVGPDTVIKVDATESITLTHFTASTLGPGNVHFS